MVTTYERSSDRRCGPSRRWRRARRPRTASPAARCPVHPVDLLAQTLRPGRPQRHRPGRGRRRHRSAASSQVGEQAGRIGRWAWLAAGSPSTCRRPTIDRTCGSSQQAADFAAQGVIAGAYDIVDRRRRRVDEPGADGLARMGAGPVRPVVHRPLRARAGAAGHLRRAGRRALEPRPRDARRVLRPLAPARRRGRRSRRLRRRDRADHHAGRRPSSTADETIRPGTTAERPGRARSPRSSTEEMARPLPRDQLERSPPATPRRSPTARRPC